MSASVLSTDYKPARGVSLHRAPNKGGDLSDTEKDVTYVPTRSERLFERGFVIAAFLIATFGLIAAVTQDYHGIELSAPPAAPAVSPAPSAPLY